MVAAPATHSLSEAVRIACRVAPSRAPLPIVSNILLEPHAGGIKVTGSDLARRVEVIAEGELNEAICVPARYASFVFRQARDAKLRTEDRKLIVECGPVSFELYGQSAEDYPPRLQLTDPKPAVVVDRDALRWVARACATDDSRPALSAVAVWPETGGMAASDGFRLHVYGDGGDPKDAFLIPLNSVGLLPKHIESIEYDEGVIEVKGEYTLVTDRIKGTFPNHQRLFPKEFEWRVETTPADLRPVLNLMREVARDGSGIVRMVGGKSTVTFSARSEEFIAAKYEMDVRPSAKFKIAFNSIYVLDALSAPSTDLLALEGTSASSQFDIRYDDGYRAVVMPMFVQW